MLLLFPLCVAKTTTTAVSDNFYHYLYAFKLLSGSSNTNEPWGYPREYINS